MSSGPNLAHLLPPSWKTDIDRWYAEDTPSFDWGGLVVGEEEQEAFLWAKSGVSSRGLSIPRTSKSIADRLSMHLQGILAGVPFFNEIFKRVDCT
jgi:nicotinate-nucleotide pyrophosphorylase (carboxylating)